MIKTIIFDVGGVITLATREDWEIMYRNFARRMGVDPQGVIDYHTNHLDDILLGTVSFAQWLLAMGITRPVDEAKQAWTEESLLLTRLNTDLLEVIKGLKNNYILQILSNVSESRILTDEAFGFYQYFDHVLLSCREHRIKPDPEFYKRALKQADARPEEALFIDDTEECVFAARRLGMKGIVFQDTEQLTKDLLNI